MSRILRRPMFRKGGPTQGMTGIMSGIVDREMHSVSDPNGVGDQNTRPTGLDDPLTQFLLQYGPALATARPTGGIIGTAIGAAKGPIQDLLAQRAATKKMEQELAGKEKLLEKELTGREKILAKEIEGRKELARMEKGEGVFKPQDFFEEYGSLTQAKNRSDYENLNLETEAAQAFGDFYEGFIGGKHGRLKDYEKKQNLGKTYYDVTDGNFKRLRKTKDGFEYEIINLKTFDPEKDKAAKIKKEEEKPDPMFGQTSKPKRTLKEAFDIKDVPTFDPYGGA